MTHQLHKYSEYIQNTHEVGFIHKNTHPILILKGLPGANLNELVVFEDDSLGIVTSIFEQGVQVASYSKTPLPMNLKVVRTNASIELPVGDGLFGKTLDMFCMPLDKSDVITGVTNQVKLEILPSNIATRKKISQPYYTGVAVVDTLLPLGKGQRELIIGDTQTGKSSFLMQVCSFQAKQNSKIVYCSIGKSKTDIKKIESYFISNGMKENVIMIVAESTDPLISIINAPFSAMSIAEYLCREGSDVTLILDDLSSHAKYYRELSLLSNKFPGRSSYPGDIFYLHARLLERAGNFLINNPNKAGCSITCFPVVDTIENDVSGYIQTNIMSITDGHLFFDKDIFTGGRRPPINYFLSVTRVGRQTQNPLRWAVNRELLSFLSLYEKVQSFVQFGAELNEGTKSTLLMGERIEASFNQDVEDTMPISLQIMILAIIWLGTWNTIDVATLKVNTKKLMQQYATDTSYAGLIDSLVYDADSMNQLLLVANQNLHNILKYV